MIALTITGLALVALLPIVRPLPGLSRSTRKIEPPAFLAFEVDDASDLDPSDAPSPTGLPRSEDNSGDPDDRADEVQNSGEWVANRPSRVLGLKRPTSSRSAAMIVIRPALVLNDRRPLFPFSTVKPGLGLPVGLCRLLI